MINAKIQKAEQLLALRDEAITLRGSEGIERGRIVRLKDGALAFDLDNYMTLLDIEVVQNWIKQAHTASHKKFV